MKPYRLTTEQVKELCIINTPTPSPPPSSGSYNIGKIIIIIIISTRNSLKLLKFLVLLFSSDRVGHSTLYGHCSTDISTGGICTSACMWKEEQ